MSAPAVEIVGVSVSLGRVRVLEDVSLQVDANDHLAILGPNGGGKTTLLKVILGMAEPDCGEVRVFGTSPRHARGRIGYVSQQFRFDIDFPIRVIDVVLMGRLHTARSGRLGAADRDAAIAALERVEMESFTTRPIGSLSGGQLQRVLIARALVRGPKLLLLDEPTASLDERIGRGFWELIDELTTEMAVIVVSHDIGAISRYVRSVACLNRRLYYHPTKKLTSEIVEASYGCPVDLLTHGTHPHRVLDGHEEGRDP